MTYSIMNSDEYMEYTYNVDQSKSHFFLNKLKIIFFLILWSKKLCSFPKNRILL